MLLSKLLNKRPDFDFLKIRYVMLAISLIMIAGVGISFVKRGFNYGIDFAGGILVEVKAEGVLDPDKIREKMQGLGLKDAIIQPIGTSGTELMIHIPTAPEQTEKEQIELLKKVKTELGEGIEYRKVEMVGPKVGSELKRNSVLAAVLASVIMSLYVWFRFEWPFALLVLLTLVHDIVLTIGLFSVLHINIDLTVIAALLAMAGYSVNDTIVSFDRVRENLRKHGKMPIPELLNLSLNETLSRTMLTGMSTLVAVLSIFFLGGEVLHGFAQVMLFGILIGTYSSIFLAVPFLSAFNLRKIVAKKEIAPQP